MPCADLGVDPHLPARLPHEAVDHRQAEAGALADGLGGEERVEGPGDHLRRHAGAGIGDAEREVLPRRQVALLRAPGSSSHLLAVSMVMRPPSGIASRALMQRLRSAFSSCGGSTSAGHRPAGADHLDCDGRARRCAGSAPPCRRPAGSRRWASGRGSGGARRRAGGGSARRRAWRRPGRRRCSGRGRSSRPCAIRVCISSRLPEMPASRLLKSCAMPPVSWPTASIFCAWRSCSSSASPRLPLGDVAADDVEQLPPLGHRFQATRRRSLARPCRIRRSTKPAAVSPRRAGPPSSAVSAWSSGIDDRRRTAGEELSLAPAERCVQAGLTALR